ncbi:hypothetical protein [Evansella halocellulosilytica]|uniref:hypothetical protein n=1 Tax=Evansella halocellulosilytica TaxID=2011013 RepID=UPI000BB7C558|nr:hypothetical protein [Evansella halocellulosilytica]
MSKFFSLFIFLFVLFCFAFTVSAENLEDKEQEKKENIQSTTPRATLLSPGTYNSGESFRPTVRTSSSSGPHTFWFQPGDGRSFRGDTTSATSYQYNPISYTVYQDSQIFTQRARVADQYNASSWVSKNVTVYQ